MSKWQQAKVRQRIDWNSHLHSLQLESAPIGFVAGQYTRLGLEIDGQVIGRPYSFVNPPDEPSLEFYFNAIPNGPLSNALAGLQPGDSLLVSPQPIGFLVLDEVPDSKALWMLATGTAIGPFLSILATAQLWQRFEQVVLAYAVRQLSDLAYSERLDRFVEQHPDRFAWQPFVSREAVDGAMDGRITTALEDGSLEARFGLELNPAQTQLMLCGNPQMVQDVMALLEPKGFSKNLRRKPGQITVERYW